MPRRYALIGDLHSQVKPMREAIRYCEDRDLFPVFLGDIFDSRCETSDSVSVYFTLRKMQESGNAVILRSNHQDKLERYIRGNPVHTPAEMLRTVDDMKEGGVYMWELLKWMESLPYGFCFKEGGKEWRCAHAFFPSWLEVPEYETHCEIRPDSKQARQLMCYGPSHKEGRGRVFWWEKDSDREWVRIAGHYHTLYQTKNSLVLDGGCGGEKRSWFCNEPPCLVVYNVALGDMAEIGV